MDRKSISRSIRKSIAKRALKDEVYNEKREFFEVNPVYKGFFRKKLDGWIVDALVVEGDCCAAPGGSIGYVVPMEASPLFPTKFSAYRWIVNNIKDYDDVYYYTLPNRY